MPLLVLQTWRVTASIPDVLVLAVHETDCIVFAEQLPHRPGMKCFLVFCSECEHENAQLSYKHTSSSAMQRLSQ